MNRAQRKINGMEFIRRIYRYGYRYRYIFVVFFVCLRFQIIHGYKCFKVYIYIERVALFSLYTIHSFCLSLYLYTCIFDSRAKVYSCAL